MNFLPTRYIEHLKICSKCREVLHKHMGLFTDEEIQKIQTEFLKKG